MPEKNFAAPYPRVTEVGSLHWEGSTVIALVTGVERVVVEVTTRKKVTEDPRCCWVVTAHSRITLIQRKFCLVLSFSSPGAQNAVSAARTLVRMSER